MASPATKELSVHLEPKTLAVRDFWRKWTICCTQRFLDASCEIACIERLKIDIQSKPMFVQFDEGLEQLLLTNRGGYAVHLTPKAWIALTWIVLDAFVSEHARSNGNLARKKQTRIAATAALDKARSLFVLSKEQDVEELSVHNWIEKGPWQPNTILWPLLFQHGLHLVNPKTEPLYWALRQRWLGMESTALLKEQDSMLAQLDTTAWCLPRPITTERVANVLRSGRRWALRTQNNMHDVADACLPTPEWKGIYLFTFWFNREENAIATTQDEMRLMSAYMIPQELCYWLVLCHDARHHINQHRHLLTTFHSLDELWYQRASNMLKGLQIFAAIPELELAMAAWNMWRDHDKQTTLALPELV